MAKKLSSVALLLGVSQLSLLGCTESVEGKREAAGGASWGGTVSINPSPRGGSGGHTPEAIRLGLGAQAGTTGGASSVGGATFGTGGVDTRGAETGGAASALCPAGKVVPTGCQPGVAEATARLCNGLDDNCDGQIDEGCPCTPGAVQSCFAGPPQRVGVGACQRGTQQCEGSGEFGRAWSACTGGILPKDELCDGLDNDCNGCVDDVVSCVPVGVCPGPGDPRTPEGHPLTDYVLRGKDFFPGQARSWQWAVTGGPCDQLASGSAASFELTNGSAENAILRPRLSGDYTVTLSVLAQNGSLFSCTWIVHIRGPGLRVEMCYPESSTLDLDLFLKRPGFSTPWYASTTSTFLPSNDQCDWHNCEASLRGMESDYAAAGTRADWGYPNSALAECSGGPQGAAWAALGYCANPRLDIDNNLTQGTGLPENINVDAPREGDSFRVMVQNFSGTLAHPLVNIYCGGERLATYGSAPNQVANFQGTSGSVRSGVGAMWRVVDITTHRTSSGSTTCTTKPLLSPSGTGYFVTYDDPSY